MAVDTSVEAQLNSAAARGVGAIGAAFEQHAFIMTTNAHYDSRVLSLMANDTLFSTSLVESKGASDTPHPPAVAPKPSA